MFVDRFECSLRFCLLKFDKEAIIYDGKRIEKASFCSPVDLNGKEKING